MQEEESVPSGPHDDDQHFLHMRREGDGVKQNIKFVCLKKLLTHLGCF